MFLNNSVEELNLAAQIQNSSAPNPRVSRDQGEMWRDNIILIYFTPRSSIPNSYFLSLHIFLLNLFLHLDML